MPSERPAVGLALGGGAARGLAHVGVLQWLEEHRIPVDHLAGTSIGGLVGGTYATGRSAADVRREITEIDFDTLFLGDVPFESKTFRRKEDRREYPVLLEMGFRKGLRLPGGLASDHAVGLLLSRLALPYVTSLAFDSLPIPFRAVATDLEQAEVVELGSGSLAQAMRATMSIPGIFAPVEVDGRLLADGGLLDNVPTDVVRAMGADVVIAVDVGASLEDREELGSFVGFADQAITVMMVARTRQSLDRADLVIAPDVDQFAATDWRRFEELIRLGYEAAESQSVALLPLALDEGAWATRQADLQRRRRQEPVVPTFLDVSGVDVRAASDIRDKLERHLAQPTVPEALERDLTSIAGAGRYGSLGYQVTSRESEPGLLLNVREKTHGPPFVNLDLELANQADTIEFNLAARVTAYDILREDAEARLDFALGSRLGARGAYYAPLGGTPLFVAPRAVYESDSQRFIRNREPIATFRTVRTGTGVDLGLSLGSNSELRVGYDLGYVDASVRVGDPILPSIDGREQAVGFRWSYDGHDHWIVPSRGTRIRSSGRWLFEAPMESKGLRQASLRLSHFVSPGERGRLFLAFDGTTSFGDEPTPFYQFTLGGPLRLSAFEVDEFRGAHSALLTVGYLRQVGRLPDFVGGSVYVAGWAESGSAFDEVDAARVLSDLAGGLVVETLLGPLVVGASIGSEGSAAFFFSIGRLFGQRPAASRDGASGSLR